MQLAFRWILPSRLINGFFFVLFTFFDYLMIFYKELFGINPNDLQIILSYS